jgi:hypothetical protein
MDRANERLLKEFSTNGNWLPLGTGGNGHSVKADDDEDTDELDNLADTTLSKLTNSIQSRIADIASNLAMAGVVGSTLIDRLRGEVGGLSSKPEELTATGASNQALGMGRGDEMAAQADSIGRYQYSAILDRNTCDPCSAEDGKEASDSADLEATPNISCEGGSLCRCFTVAIVV